MECKKCKKECLESELKDGICYDCINKTNNKNSMIITIIISVCISVVISLIIVGWANSEVSLSSFKIESFNMDTEKNTYTYMDDSYSYTGRGKITCTNKRTNYIVLIEEKDKTTNNNKYDIVVVHDGEGTFSTYDSSYSGTTQKPEYEINIIGYRSFKK